eukprot:871470-Prymnesium_polylepis.1
MRRGAPRSPPAGRREGGACAASAATATPRARRASSRAPYGRRAKHRRGLCRRRTARRPSRPSGQRGTAERRTDVRK